MTLDDEFMRVKAVQKVLPLSTRSLYRLAELGELPAIKVNTSVLFSRDGLQKFLASRLAEAAR